MSKTPFMPLWNGDLLADTLELDATEMGAYLLLIIAQWQRKGASLPGDPKRLQRIARCGRSWPKVWDNIGHFFATDEAGVYSAKGREMYKNRAVKTIVNSQNGALGGLAKALKSKERLLANANETLQRKADIPYPYIKEEEREAKASPKKTLGTRLSETWVLPRDWGDWALSEGLDTDAIRDQADKFRDYWIGVAGAKARKADWAATWRNWIRKYIDDHKNQKGRGNGKPSANAAFGAAINQVARDLSLGTITLDNSRSHPFAARPRRDTAPDQRSDDDRL